MINLVRRLKRLKAATHKPRAGGRPGKATLSNAFTPRAREVIYVAHEEARGLGHEFLGTEHILLALLSQDRGTAASVLHNLGATRARALREIERTVGRGSYTAVGPIRL